MPKNVRMQEHGWPREKIRLFHDLLGLDRPAIDAELRDAFEAAGGVGARVTLTVQNGGERREVQLTLVEINR